MTERATAVQATQLGPETTMGTAVTAGKQLASVGFTAGVKLDAKPERSQGWKVPTAVSIGKEWTEGTFSGFLGYNDVAYILDSLLHTTTPTGATADKTWTWTPAVRSADTPRSYTMQVGDAATRHLTVAGVVFTGLAIEWTKERISVSGDWLGGVATDAAGAMDAATVVANVAAQPGDLDVYLDPTSGGLGTTKLDRVLKAKLEIKGRWGPVFTADSSKPSYSAVIERDLEAVLTLTMAADTQSMAYLTTYRDGTLVYPRLNILGGTLGSSAYRFRADLAARIQKMADPFSDVDGIYAHEVQFTTALDPSWGGGSGRALQVSVVNALASL